jgi:putative transposase
MPRERITLKLSEQAEQFLKQYVSQGQKNAREINRARILLLANEGRKVKEIKQVLGVSSATICNVRNTYNQHEHEHILEVIQDKPRSGRPLKLDSRVAAQVSMIACSEPPVGAARWTLQLIADKLVKLEAVESISHESVRQLLKKPTQALVK